MLRNARTRAQASSEETFAVTVITGSIATDGHPATQQTYHLSTGTSWAGMQSALTDMTTGWQAREAGFPSGYSLVYGNWLYQLAKDVLEKVVQPLAAEEDYGGLRKRMREEKQTSILIWHERVWEASQKAPAEAEEDKKAKGLRDDWVKHNGWMVWDPFDEPDAGYDVEIDIFDGDVHGADTEMETGRLAAATRQAQSDAAQTGQEGAAIQNGVN